MLSSNIFSNRQYHKYSIIQLLQYRILKLRTPLLLVASAAGFEFIRIPKNELPLIFSKNLQILKEFEGFPSLLF